MRIIPTLLLVGTCLLAQAQDPSPTPSPAFRPVPDSLLRMAQADPEYPGGMAALQAFVRDHIQYPEEAREAGTTGRVNVYFFIETSGDVDSVWVPRSLDHALDQEAMRVVRLLDGWSPGRANGEPVRALRVLPVTFHLEVEEAPKKKKRR